MCECVRLCVNVCAQKIEEEGAIEGAEKRQARKFQDPSSGDHQPGMADSREQAAGRVQSRRGAPPDLGGAFGIISMAAINPSLLILDGLFKETSSS